MTVMHSAWEGTDNHGNRHPIDNPHTVRKHGAVVHMTTEAEEDRFDYFAALHRNRERRAALTPEQRAEEDAAYETRRAAEKAARTCEHRRPCQVLPPGLAQQPIGHQHACKHDATSAWGTTLEHECACGMTWTENPYADGRRKTSEQLLAEYLDGKAQDSETPVMGIIGAIMIGITVIVGVVIIALAWAGEL